MRRTCPTHLHTLVPATTSCPKSGKNGTPSHGPANRGQDLSVAEIEAVIERILAKDAATSRAVRADDDVDAQDPQAGSPCRTPPGRAGPGRLHPGLPAQQL